MTTVDETSRLLSGNEDIYESTVDKRSDPYDDVRLSTSDSDNGAKRGCDDMEPFRTLYPSGFTTEMASLFRLSLPIVMTQVCQMIIGPISLIFCGHLGDKMQLDGAALSICMINATCIAIGQGLGTACDTFFSQTFGSSNKKQVGVYMQKAILIFLLALMPCYAFHLNIEVFFVAVGQDPVVSKKAARYMLIFMPGSLFFFMYVVISKFLQNQNIVIPNVIIGVTANAANAIMHYILLYIYDFGTDGSAISQSVSYGLLFILTLLYILISKVYEDTWDGWSIQALQEWGKFVKICVPGMLMLCMEWWGFEIGVFLTGLLGTTELGAQAVLLQLDSIWFQVPLGIQIACAIRVGQDVGSGNTVAAITVSRLALTLVVLLSFVTVTLFLLLPHKLPYLFTNVEEVVDLTAKLMPIVALYVFFDGLATACKGVLYGTGRQLHGAILLFVTYYVIALPCGTALIFCTPLRSAGYWWALAANLVIQSFCLLIMVFRTNWPEEVIKARDRAGLLGELIIERIDREEQCPSNPLAIETIDTTCNSPKSQMAGHVTTKRCRLLSASLTMSEVHVVIEDSAEMTFRSLFCRRLICFLVMATILGTGIMCRILFNATTMYGDAHFVNATATNRSTICHNGVTTTIMSQMFQEETSTQNSITVLADTPADEI